MKIKVSENFYSPQGEGLYVGVPSIFLRVFGCNFTCSGFGMPRGVLSDERNKISPDDYASFKDLPLVSTGCDSFPSWDPRFKHLSPMLDVTAIVDQFQKLLPQGKFSRDKHLIITGGEPLLGWQRAYPDLLNEIARRDLGLTNLTFETNGTQKLTPEFKEYLTKLASEGLEVTFSISAKLPCSGEPWDKAILPAVVKDYLDIPNHTSYFKFVVADQEDVDDVFKAVDEYKLAGIDIPVYLMPIGGTVNKYTLNHRNVAELAMKSGFRYSPRLQVDLFKNSWGT